MLTNAIRFVIAVGVIISLYFAAVGWSTQSTTTLVSGSLYSVQSGTLTSTVNETGKIKCRDTDPMSCLLDGVENKIVTLVKQGESVKKGDIVVGFDPSALNEKLVDLEKQINSAQQKVKEVQNNLQNQKNKNENEIATSKNAVENKKLILEKYEKCDYDIKVLELKSEIASSAAELDKQDEELQKIDVLVGKGFRTARQRREKKQLVVKAQAELDRDKQKLTAFQDFEHTLNLSQKREELLAARRKLKEVEIDARLQVKKISFEIESAQEAARILEKDYSYFKNQISHCNVKANSDGVVKYIKEDYSGTKSFIGLGKAARFRQQLFYILNDNEMLIHCTLDDTVVRKARVGQKVIVRARSHQNTRLTGVVEHIGVLGSYNGEGAQGYTTLIRLDELPADVSLNPGVEADVEIIVGSRANVLMVPVTSVYEYLGDFFVFVKQDGAFHPTKIEIGLTNDEFVEAQSGLAPNTNVVSNCRNVSKLHFPNSYLDGAKMKSELVSKILANSSVNDTDQAAADTKD